MSHRTVALLPTALLALLVFWCGTFQGAASAAGAIGYQTAILLFCLLAPRLGDPLDLGGSGRLLPLALFSVVAVSWWQSPVDRAGVVGIILLPAYFLLPAVASWLWREPQARRAGLVSLTFLTLVVSLASLITWQSLSLERASLPLGHHNLLAGWLVLVLPLTLASLGLPGLPRWLAIGAATTGLLTLVASQSLLAAGAVAVQAIVAALMWKRLRIWLVPVALLFGVLAVPRLTSIWESADPSALARLSYLAAGWQGLRARPALGWGPGAVPWTVGEFMRPVAGTHPASQVVGDLHSLPVQTAYEIGIAGLLLTLAIAILFLLRRLRESKGTAGISPQRAALLGLLGGAVFALGSAPLAVPALPATAALVSGMAMQAREPSPARRRIALLLIYLVVATIVLWPLAEAHLLYDRARRAATPAGSLAHLGHALEADPEFPLYRARHAWLSATLQGTDEESSIQALRAAQSAPGLAPLWLAAGDLGRRAHQPWASAAAAQAFRLDPLSPMMAFHAMLARDEDQEAARLGGFAVSSEPNLAAARWWLSHRELAERVSQQIGRPIPNPIESKSSEPMVLALTLDRNPAVSFSLYAFRRSPWAGRLAPVALIGDESATTNTSHP